MTAQAVLAAVFAFTAMTGLLVRARQWGCVIPEGRLSDA